MLEVFGLMRYNYLFIKHGLVLVDLGTQGQFAEVSHVSHFLGNFYCKLTLQSLIFSLVLFQPVEGIARATNTFASPSKYLLKFISNDIFLLVLIGFIGVECKRRLYLFSNYNRQNPFTTNRIHEHFLVSCSNILIG